MVSSCCSNRMEPVTRETSAGKRPMTASADTVLPEPLSPTRPSVVPGASEKVASSMTGSHFCRVRNSIRNPLTERSAGSRSGTDESISMSCFAAGTAAIRWARDPSLPRPISPPPEGRSRPSESRRPSATRLKARTVNMIAIPGKIDSPRRRVDELKSFLEHSAPARRRRLLADAEEAQSSLGQHGEAKGEGELDDDR